MKTKENGKQKRQWTSHAASTFKAKTAPRLSLPPASTVCMRVLQEREQTLKHQGQQASMAGMMLFPPECATPHQ